MTQQPNTLSLMYDTGHKTTNLAKQFILITTLLMNVNRKIDIQMINILLHLNTINIYIYIYIYKQKPYVGKHEVLLSGTLFEKIIEFFFFFLEIKYIILNLLHLLDATSVIY